MLLDASLRSLPQGQEPALRSRPAPVSVEIYPHERTGDFSAKFLGLDTFDTRSQETRPIDYRFDAFLQDKGETLQLVAVDVAPLAPDGHDYPLDYAYRPGLRNTMAALRTLASRLKDEYPQAKTLEISGERLTAGFVGNAERDFTLPL